MAPIALRDLDELLAASSEGALTLKHRRGLKSLQVHRLLPPEADLLSDRSFILVCNSQRDAASHGEERAALNQLREINGLARLGSSGCKRKTPTPGAGAGSGAGAHILERSACHARERPAADEKAREESRPAKRQRRGANSYSKGAVVATAAGEGSEDPFWLAVILAGKDAGVNAGNDIPIRWLERDARYSDTPGEVFWSGKDGVVGADYIVCQVRDHWVPKQIAGWTLADSAFLCSCSEVQMVSKRLREFEREQEEQEKEAGWQESSTDRSTDRSTGSSSSSSSSSSSGKAAVSAADKGDEKKQTKQSKKRRKKGPDESSSSEEELNEREEDIEVRDFQPLLSQLLVSFPHFWTHFLLEPVSSCLGFSDRCYRGGCACVW